MTSLLNATTFIVDDDPFVGALYKKSLQNLGFQHIHYFPNGEDCYNSLHLNPAIVLLDHQMPGITGFEVLRKIKRYNPDTAVIMVSGQKDMTTALDALKYGAFDYIIKDNTETVRIEQAINRLAALDKLSRSKGKSLFKKFTFSL